MTVASTPLIVRYPSHLTYATKRNGADVLRCGALVFGHINGCAEDTWDAYRGGERFTVQSVQITEARFGYNHTVDVEYRAYAPGANGRRMLVGTRTSLGEAAALLAELVDTTDIDPDAPVYL